MSGWKRDTAAALALLAMGCGSYTGPAPTGSEWGSVRRQEVFIQPEARDEGRWQRLEQQQQLEDAALRYEWVRQQTQQPALIGR